MRDSSTASAPSVRPETSPGACRVARLDFDPARDGFAFRNHFVWTEKDLRTLAASLRPISTVTVALTGAAGGAVGGRLLGAVLGGGLGAVLGGVGIGDALVRAVARRWPSFGLCGGMALAAAERWPAAGRVPTSELRPDFLRPLLRRRQETTLRASLAQFARLWARVRFDPTGAAEAPFADALRRELDRVEHRLAAGRPALLGLVGDAPDPFALHQVVAFGMERHGPLTATLSVYDPNAPGRTRHVHTAPGAVLGRTAISTDLPTGPTADGRVHISSRLGHLAHVFVVDVPV